MTLMFLTDHTSASMHALSRRIVGQWNEQRPGMPVTMAALDHEEFRGQVGQLLDSAHPPDVMTWFAGNQAAQLTERGLLLDIAGLWTPAGFTRSYAPRFQPGAGAGEPVYFLPTTCYWWAVYYRPSVFASLGIQAPPETWPDLLRAGQALRRAGIAPFALAARHLCPAAAWFDYLDMRLNGPAFHRDLMALRVPYTSDRVSQVFAFWRRLLETETFLGDPVGYDEAAAVAAVLDGRAGMTLIGSYISDEYVPVGCTDLSFFRFPLIVPGLPVGEDSPVDGYCVAGRSPAPEDARAFLAFLGSRAVQQQNVEAMHVLPTRRDVSVEHARHVVEGAEILGRADYLGQFYDLDTPWELAGVAMRAFVAFVRDPARGAELMAEVESLRLRLLEAGPGESPHPAPTPPDPPEGDL